jgi:hypothetical protein
MEDIMNRIDFYTNLAKFKKKDGELKHASQYNYYNKLDKYYPDGSARYFYTKAEWDAYQDGINQGNYKNEQAKKKVAEDRNDMSGYASWKKKEDEKKRIEKQTQQQINNNAEASKHEGDRYIEKNKELNKAISGRESAIKKSQSANQNSGKDKGITTELYEHKDEIIKKANSYLKLADEKVNDFINKFTEDFPPELKNKLQDVLNDVKDYAGDLIDKIIEASDNPISNINDLLDKLISKVQDKLDKYVDELSDIYQKFKDKINPVFKDENGNINWKLFLPLFAGASLLQFIATHPDECYAVFSKIYDVGKKAFNFIDEKSNGKFSQALSEIPKMIDRYAVYKRLEKQGLGTFTTVDDNGNRVSYLDYAFNNYINATDDTGLATMIAEGMKKS